MKKLIWALTAVATLQSCAHAGPRLTIETLGSRTVLRVWSHTFAAGGSIPFRNSNYGANVAPDIAWSGVPSRTKSLVVLVEDPDVPGGGLFTHWIVYALSPAQKGLPLGTPSNRGNIKIGVQGQNDAGGLGYFGPRPPDSAPHHYHFEVFALDARIRPRPGYTRDQLIPAMHGHVIASGELVGMFTKPR